MDNLLELKKKEEELEEVRRDLDDAEAAINILERQNTYFKTSSLYDEERIEILKEFYDSLTLIELQALKTVICTRFIE